MHIAIVGIGVSNRPRCRVVVDIFTRCVVRNFRRRTRLRIRRDYDGVVRAVDRNGRRRPAKSAIAKLNGISDRVGDVFTRGR